MEQVITDWLIHNLPPDAAPYLLWTAANYDFARPTLVALFTAVVVFEAALLSIIWRTLTR